MFIDKCFEKKFFYGCDRNYETTLIYKYKRKYEY
jgi:hypothetical protein